MPPKTKALAALALIIAACVLAGRSALFKVAFERPTDRSDVEALLSEPNRDSVEVRRYVDRVAGSYLRGGVYDMADRGEIYTEVSKCYGLLGASLYGRKEDGELADVYTRLSTLVARTKNFRVWTLTRYVNVLARSSKLDEAQRLCGEIKALGSDTSERNRFAEGAIESFEKGKRGKRSD